ncbi:hypothetical protein U1Q18_026450 [Sarracenia purpurea var. burkii]
MNPIGVHGGPRAPTIVGHTEEVSRFLFFPAKSQILHFWTFFFALCTEKRRSHLLCRRFPPLSSLRIQLISRAGLHRSPLLPPVLRQKPSSSSLERLGASQILSFLYGRRTSDRQKSLCAFEIASPLQLPILLRSVEKPSTVARCEKSSAVAPKSTLNLY